MRGFRCLGPVSEVSVRDFHESDLLYFAPDVEGEGMRTNGIRARDFNFEACRVAVVAGLLHDEFMFVPTALGEACFK